MKRKRSRPEDQNIKNTLQTETVTKFVGNLPRNNHQSLEANKNQLGKELCAAGTRTKDMGTGQGETQTIYIHEDNRGQLETIRNQVTHEGRARLYLSK